MQRFWGALLVAGSGVAFGTMPILARIAYDAGANPTTVLFLRFAIAAVCMVLVMGSRNLAWPRGRVLLGLVLMGGLGFVLQSLAYFTALTLASAGLVALLLYLYPAIVTLLSALLLKERMTKTKISALTLALVGTALTIGPNQGGSPLGIALGIASALIYSVYLLAGDRLLKQVAAVPASSVIMASAAVVFGGLVAVQGAQFPATAVGWAAILGIALVSTVLAIVALLAGLERVGPTNASMLSTLEPVVTVMLAALVLAEAITPLRLLGGLLILLAVMVLARGELGVETA
ncbi:DMT family transporter [Leptolyngbya sp. FACHB-261]|uniref:DMT family transporter n=1 Tax=Leptolyngbya sp. FACHB-261 TaxID=2692806 RepID=UPI001686FE5F|nr:DMT family transporter [Leptolyngbya sp. FACHB-261]MBD2100579.1 DMT family transporter [Leptolyngbya sp. FACHB-261]